MKRNARRAADSAMSVLMILLMAYALIGKELHEWLGIGFFAVFLVHHFLNRSWHRNLLRGKYSRRRTAMTVTDLLILLCVLLLIYSSLVLSRYVFGFLPAMPGAETARTIHRLASYWGYLLMVFHLGMHLQGIRRSGRIVLAAVSAYGLYSFFMTGFASCLIETSGYAFIDYQKPIPLFLAEYLSIAGLFAGAGALLFQMPFMQSRLRRKNENQKEVSR